jgi:hypothetical protein
MHDPYETATVPECPEAGPENQHMGMQITAQLWVLGDDMSTLRLIPTGWLQPQTLLFYLHASPEPVAWGGEQTEGRDREAYIMPI